MDYADRVKVVRFDESDGIFAGVEVLGAVGTIFDIVGEDLAIKGRTVEVQLDESFRLMFEPSELEVIS